MQDSASNLSQLQQKYGISDGFVYHLGENEFVIPGLIDTHIHAPQYPNAGLGYDKQLLDWLKIYTFPLEIRYADLNFATKVYEAIVVSTHSLLLKIGCFCSFQLHFMFMLSFSSSCTDDELTLKIHISSI